MGSKSLLLLGLLLACALLVASEVAAARELAEAASTSKENSKETNGVEEAHYGRGYGGNPRGGRGYCDYGCCRWGIYGCETCCSYRGETMDTGPEAKPPN